MNDKNQINKFKDAARKHNADESVENFERNLKKIAKAPRSDETERGTKIENGKDDTSDDE